MRLFNIFNKSKKNEKQNVYANIEQWLDIVLKQNIPTEVVALNFNLYDDGDNNWSIELIGTDTFDSEDEDWACNEVYDFGTRKNPFRWNEEKEWNEIFDEMVNILKKYLESGKYSSILKGYQGIGIGFVDGDLEIIFTK